MPDYPFITLRVILGPDTLLGRGKAELLSGVRETGSIAAAGRRMGMSYKRAWYLIDTLNGYFGTPLVSSTKGGRGGGGAALTETGEAVLALVLSIQRKAEAATDADLRALASLAAKASPPS